MNSANGSAMKGMTGLQALRLVAIFAFHASGRLSHLSLPGPLHTSYNFASVPTGSPLLWTHPGGSCLPEPAATEAGSEGSIPLAPSVHAEAPHSHQPPAPNPMCAVGRLVWSALGRSANTASRHDHHCNWNRRARQLRPCPG